MYVKITNLTNELNCLRPKYETMIFENNNYHKKKDHIQIQMIDDGILDPNNINIDKLNNEFLNKYPEHPKFVNDYNKVVFEFKNLTENIRNLIEVYNKIIASQKKIIAYFKNRSTSCTV